MIFPAFDFEAMNESDVREEIIAPLLRELGYRSGTVNNIIREQHLVYPRSQLGRQKAKDPLLRGKADYICVAGGKVRWVIEAKPPSEKLNEQTEAQAHSYAVHPEIRAVLFVATNGREFKVYQSNRGPDATPVLHCTYDELSENLIKIKNILGPESMLREHRDFFVDTGLPLGLGLRSIERIASGQVKYTKIVPYIRPIAEMVLTIVNGSVQRNEFGCLEVTYWTQAPFQSLQDFNVQFGFDHITFLSADSEISTDPLNLTTFCSKKNVTIPIGTRMLNIMDWKENTLPSNVDMDGDVIVEGYLNGRTFIGSFFSKMSMDPPGLEIQINGSFVVHLA